MNNPVDLLIANAELAADLLQHMADDEIDSDYFAVVTDSPNCGREVQSEHSVTEVALMATGIIEQLIAQLEAAQKENGELVMSLNVANDSTGIWKDRVQKAEAALLAATEACSQPVAEVVVKFGDPESFGEREIKALVDLHRIPYNTKLYAVTEQAQPNTLISFDELADRVKFVTGGIRMEFDPQFYKGHQAVPFMNFNSLSHIVEMYRTTETFRLTGGGSNAEIQMSPLPKDSH
ncbi:hypothetical protein PGS49_20940 [Yersinia intermedia]|uniref:hypothetical protein n=1 Tax=Yersinia intermedia TaxID=631 RepID=UPI00119CCEF8|nr:hypothetical protein [Yersinia intermedia]MDA5483088.1 hypothetical protein [Yersinia intermedia]